MTEGFLKSNAKTAFFKAILEDTVFFINFRWLFLDTFGKDEARFGPTEAKKLLNALAISIAVLVILSFTYKHFGNFYLSCFYL